MTTPQPPILVLGSGLTVLGAIRLLGRAGLTPLVVGKDPGIAGKSRWYRPAPASASSARPEDDLAAWLNGLPIERAVVLPCSDDWMLRTAKCADAIGARFSTCVSSHHVLETLIDKWKLAEILTELDLPHPRTLSLEASSSAADISDAALDGAFIKPRDSAQFFRHFGVKAFRVSSRKDLEQKLTRTSELGISVELQEYVPGPATNHYYVEGFIDRFGNRRALFTRQRIRMYPPDFGNSTVFTSMHPSEIPDAVDTVTRLLTHLDFRGIFSVELKRDVRDGICRLIEVNARPWWYVEFAGQCGVNVCGMYVADALGEPVADVDAFTLGKTCVYPYYDYFACRELREQGALSTLSWARSWLTATQPVLRWNDPRPASGALGIVARKVGQLFARSGTP